MRNLLKVIILTIIVVPLVVMAQDDFYKHLPKYVKPFQPIDVHTTQNIYAYLDHKTMNQSLISSSKQKRDVVKFFQRHFAPWSRFGSYYLRVHLKNYELTQINAFSKNLGYGENFHRHTKAWFDAIVKNMGMANFPNTSKLAIAVHNANVRLFPTMDPHFGNYLVAGQGYPFDHFQNSAIWVGTPLRVLQISEDGAWAFVITPSVEGWVQTKNMAYVSGDFMKQWQQKTLVATIVKSFPMKDSSGLYRFTSYMGGVFPLIKEEKNDDDILIPVKDLSGNAVIKEATVSKKVMQKIPWTLTSAHVAHLIKQLLGQPYGWGGIYFYGDCSSSLKNIYTVFGLWLPRNSLAQSKAYPNMSLQDLSPEDRVAAVFKYGKPFMTLIYVTGHIMLYIGKYKNDVMTFQDVWAFVSVAANGRMGRDIIGKAVLMPLKLRYGDTGMYPQIDGDHLTLVFLDR